MSPCIFVCANEEKNLSLSFTFLLCLSYVLFFSLFFPQEKIKPGLPRLQLVHILTHGSNHTWKENNVSTQTCLALLYFSGNTTMNLFFTVFGKCIGKKYSTEREKNNCQGKVSFHEEKSDSRVVIKEVHSYFLLSRCIFFYLYEKMILLFSPD